MLPQRTQIPWKPLPKGTSAAGRRASKEFRQMIARIGLAADIRNYLFDKTMEKGDVMDEKRKGMVLGNRLVLVEDLSQRVHCVAYGTRAAIEEYVTRMKGIYAVAEVVKTVQSDGVLHGLVGHLDYTAPGMGPSCVRQRPKEK